MSNSSGRKEAQQSLNDLIGTDGELREGEHFSTDISTSSAETAPRKSKRLNKLSHEIETILEGNGQKKALLDDFVAEIHTYFELNQKLQAAKKEFSGCRLKIDAFYYTPAILYLLDHVGSGKLVGQDFTNAAILFAASYATFYVFDQVNSGLNKAADEILQKKESDDDDDNDDEAAGETTGETDNETAREKYRRLKGNVANTISEIKEQEKVLRTYIELLGLQQTNEVHKSRSFNKILEQVAAQHKDFTRTQGILDKARKKLSAEE
jgi:hypothetical protein